MASGYGRFAIRKNLIDQAHRVSWRLHFGEIPPKTLVCHKCDVKLCVRPEHLFLGSYADNTRDMVLKHRHTTKLSAAEVRNIRDGSKFMTYAELSKIHGVTTGMIGHIVNRRAWKHV